MKFNFPVSVLGSALAFYGRQDGGPALQTQQIGQPANGTESLADAMRPLVNADDPTCAAAIAAVSADPAVTQCCTRMEQLTNQTLLSAPATSGWLDGFCGAACPSHYNVSTGQIADACEFKPQLGMSPAEVEDTLKAASDILSSVTCLKDSTGNYCLVTIWERLRANVTGWASNPTTYDPEVMKQLMINICEIPCGRLFFDAIQEYTGSDSSTVCAALSSAGNPPSILPPSILPPATAPSATSTPVAAGPQSTASPATPTETPAPLPGPAGRLVRRFRDLLK